MNISDLGKRITGVLLQTGDFTQALTEMMEAIETDKEETERAVAGIKAREDVMATYIVEDTIAPRLKTDGKGFDIITGILRSPMEYKSGRIRIILLFVYSPDNEDMYVSALAYVIRLFLSKSFRDRLVQCDDGEDIEEMIIDGLKEIED